MGPWFRCVFLRNMCSRALQVFCVAMAASFSFAADEFPEIELSLAPPVHPAPDALLAIGSLEMARERAQSAFVADFHRAARALRAHARARIGEIAAHASRALCGPSGGQLLRSRASFLGENRPEAEHARPMGLRVRVLGSRQPLPAPHAQLMRDMERVRADAEEQRVRKALRAMGDIVARALDELSASVEEHVARALAPPASGRFGAVGFAEKLSGRSREGQLSPPANVHIVPGPAPYPTLASLVEGMNDRRGVSESLESAGMMRVLANLLQEINAMAAHALQGVVRRAAVGAAARSAD